MMEQNNPEEVATTSSDFEAFVNESPTTKDAEKADVHCVLADAKKVKDFITCVKCKLVFDRDSHKPFLLPCLDAICKSCIQEISALERQSYACRKCQCDHICFQHGEILLTIDNTREIVCEINRINNIESGEVCGMCASNQTALHCCFDCSVFICADCYNLHQTLRPLRSHSVVELKSFFNEKTKNFKLFHKMKYCPLAGHEKEILKMHCLHPSCMKTVCILCAISSHKDHNLCDITDIGKKSEAKLETFLSKIDLKIKQARNLFDELSDIDEKFQKDSEQLQQEIKTLFINARLALEQKEKNFCESVVTRLVDKQTKIENEKKEIISFINSCEHASLYSNVSSEINDYLNFIDIAKIIQLRLENLQLCVPENRVTVDTMIFSSELPDSCFGTPIDGLGKLSVTSVDSSKSYVVVTVAEYDANQEIQFEIHLFSSTGNCIHDEDVRISLKLNDIVFKEIECAFKATYCTFFGSFVPDKPWTLFWSVVSNNVQHQNLSGVINMKETDKSIIVDPTSTNVNFMTCIPMAKREYLAALYFGNKYNWLKNIENKVKYANGSLCMEIDVDGTAKENIMKLLYSIQLMSSDILFIYKDIDVQKAMQKIEQMNLRACLIWNEDYIEIISDSYEDIMRGKQIVSSKPSTRRRGRTFKKSEETEETEETNQNINSNGNSISLIRTNGCSLVKVKTKEGLIVNVYEGIITHLKVDCIANAANERLRHCTGVAALIAEAAGYQFDRECREYVKDHGPIPVRSCCVTSAGKLPYKCVINTVGPKWDDYCNKNQCLKDLHDSIHVTFIEADRMGMKSLAIPPIGSGIFAVPRDICVQQYYKAVMSFSRNYPFKSLKEIDLVDKDESMILAIQEIFQRREGLQ